jgi:uncharacterized protein
MRKIRSRTATREIPIPGGTAEAFEVKQGQTVTIVDVEGGQVADFIAFNKADIKETLSPTHTRTSLLSLRFTVGDLLRSTLRNPMFEVVEDTVGNHDFMLAACDERRYLVDYGVENHRNCVANFEEVLCGHGIAHNDLPDPFNFFQCTQIDTTGCLIQAPSTSVAGDSVTLWAEMDLICAVSACPMDLNPIGGNRITDILVRIDTVG